MQRIYPRDRTTRANLGVAYNQTGQFEKAAAQCREMLQIDPSIYNCWGTLAFNLVSLDRLDEAKGIVNQGLARGFQNPALRTVGFSIAFQQRDQAELDRLAEWGRQNDEPRL